MWYLKSILIIKSQDIKFINMPHFDSENIMQRSQSILELFRICQHLYIPSSLIIVNNFISDTVILQYNCREKEKEKCYHQLKRFNFNIML